MYRTYVQQQEKNYNLYACGRCGGGGHISCYNHVMGGVCFQCKGTGQFRYPTPPVNYTPSNTVSFHKSMKRRWNFVVAVAGSDYYIIDSFTYDGLNKALYERRHHEYVNEANSKLPNDNSIKLLSGNCGEKKSEAIKRLQLKLTLPKAA